MSGVRPSTCHEWPRFCAELRAAAVWAGGAKYARLVPRPPRHQVAGGTYHVNDRGNRRQTIFRADPDYELFLSLLGTMVTRLGWVCHAYCLMPNHLHLLLTTPEPNLSYGLQRLLGSYAQVFNERHGVDGHLFQGRFHSVLVESTEHLLELARYLPLNPVRAHLCPHPADWRWSSYRATAGLEREPRGLSTEWLLREFDADVQAARRAFAAFVRDGMASGQAPLREAA
jgi:putative transposase